MIATITNGKLRESKEIVTGWLRALPGKSPTLMKPAWFPVYGRIEPGADRKGVYNPMWMDWKVLIGIPYDMKTCP